MASSDRTRGSGHKQTTKFDQCKKTHFFTVEMVKAQVAQRGGGVSIFGGVKNTTVNRPEQCVLLVPTLSKEAGLNNLQRSLLTSSIL